MTFTPSYQKASKEMKRQVEEPSKILRSAASIGASVAGGSAIFGRILPFLNQHIPQDIAIKGLSKISPKIGKFMQNALSSGYGIDEVKEFIKEKSQPKEEEPAKDNRNIIRKYSDKLDEFLNKEIQQGRQPLEAGALAQLQPEFKKVIDKMVKDHKTPFSSILESVFGSTQQPQQQQGQAQQGPMQQTQQGPENNDQAIMAALQKILQM